MILLDPDLEPHPSRLRLVPARGVSGSTPRAKVPHPGTEDSAARSVLRRIKVPSTRLLTRFLAEAQAAVRLRGQVSVLLTTDTAIRRLNRQFRGIDKATDVLSFPAVSTVSRKVAGDLAIRVPTARRQAVEQGHALGTEIKVLILHGLLHLAGYDHEDDSGQMARRERRLRTSLRLPLGLIERTTKPVLMSAKPSTPSLTRSHRAKAAKLRAQSSRSSAVRSRS
jgi:probable rRNA maturation factor